LARRRVAAIVDLSDTKRLLIAAAAVSPLPRRGIDAPTRSIPEEHGDPRVAVVADASSIHGDDVGVAELGGDVGFADKTRAEIGVM
jgi:hypothetical protein